MSFLKKLFGGGGDAGAASGGGAALGEESYKGFLITAIEMRAGAEYQLAGTIEKDVNGERKTYQFVRADRISSRDELVSMALAKGRQIIDEQGEGVFSQTWPRQAN
ncbi:MAG TPA: hypothetical protein GYA10_00675 [Alphaproteobacteria bacterium]|nr:hypothetical protein [Alphaproteobacteria bacterium]